MEEVGAARTRLLGAPLRIVGLRMLVPVPVSAAAASVRALPACVQPLVCRLEAASICIRVCVCVSAADALSPSLPPKSCTSPLPLRVCA